MKKLFQPKFVSRVVGAMMSVISIFGGMGAWNLSYGREPERYLVSALVMLCSGILWLVYSIYPKFELPYEYYKFILVVLMLGLTLGLFYSFDIYGGECGGMSIHTQSRGYPGRWLVNSRCMATSSTAWWDGRWGINFPHLAADVVFWSGVGLIIPFVHRIFKSKTSITSTGR